MGQQCSTKKSDPAGLEDFNRIGIRKQFKKDFKPLSNLWMENCANNKNLAFLFGFKFQEDGLLPRTTCLMLVHSKLIQKRSHRSSKAYKGYRNFSLQVTMKSEKLKCLQDDLLYKLQVKVMSSGGTLLADLELDMDVLQDVFKKEVLQTEFEESLCKLYSTWDVVIIINFTFIPRASVKFWPSDANWLESFKKKAFENFQGYLQQKDHDITIVSREGERFQTHRSILVARSSVFAAMFQAGMEEQNTGVIQMRDLSSSGVNFLLQYLKAESIPPLKVCKEGGTEEACAEELVNVAKMYELDDLFQYLDMKMAQKLSAENALDLLKLANRYDMPILRKKIQTLLQRNSEVLNNLMNVYC